MLDEVKRICALLIQRLTKKYPLIFRRHWRLSKMPVFFRMKVTSDTAMRKNYCRWHYDYNKQGELYRAAFEELLKTLTLSQKRRI